MKDVSFAIPQWVIDTAIEGLQELAWRLEDDAVSLARLDTLEARALAQERLEQARAAWKGHEFFIGL